jgi:hypothetical protein
VLATILLFINRFFMESLPDEDTMVITFINKVKRSAYIIIVCRHVPGYRLYPCHCI